MKGESEKVNALAIGAASFASTSKDIADSAAQRETPQYKPGDKFRLPEGTKAICAPTPQELELGKMYKGPYKTPQEKAWDKMIKR